MVVGRGDMIKDLYKGKVSKFGIGDEAYLVLDMPHKPEDATVSFSIEALLPIEEIFLPYLGKSITVKVDKEEGRVRRITIEED